MAKLNQISKQRGASRRGLYLPDDWGQYWLPKYAAAAGSGASVAVVGDSITQRFDASTYAKSWVGLLRAALQTAQGDGGSGFLSTINTIAAGTENTNFADRILTTGTWTSVNVNTNRAGPGAVALSSVVDASTITFTGRGTRVTIPFLRYSGGGTWTYSIDGGAAISQSVNGVDLGTVVVSGLAGGSHTVVITKTGTTAANVCGVTFDSPGSGVVVHNYGHSGAASDRFNNVVDWGAGANAAKWSGGSLNPADLVIYAMGANDAAGSVTASAYALNVRRFLMDVRSANNGQQDILFILPSIGNFDQTTPIAHEYVAQLLALAHVYGAAFLNLGAFWGNSYAAFNALGGWSNGHTGTGASGTDPIHPGDTGHQLYANKIIPVVQGFGLAPGT